MLVTGDRIGDALLKWPAIVGLRSRLPQCHITWIAGRRASVFCGPFAELASGTIDRAVDFASLGANWLELFRPPPEYSADIVISTEPKMRDAILAKRIPHQRFISPAANFFFSDAKPAQSFAPSSVAERLQQLFELAIEQPIELHDKVEIKQALISSAAAILGNKDDYIGFSPGAGGKSKRWPLENFLAVASEQEKLGRTPVFFLGPDEEHMLSDIRSKVPNAVFPEFDDQFQRRAGALFSIALAKFMQVSLANDAGGGHLLSAGGQPLVTLYGHTNAKKFSPRYGRHHAITATAFGSQDMDVIPVTAVLEAIEQMLP